MCKVIKIENNVRNKVRRLLSMDYKPSEIAVILGKPLSKIHKCMME